MKNQPSTPNHPQSKENKVVHSTIIETDTQVPAKAISKKTPKQDFRLTQLDNQKIAYNPAIKISRKIDTATTPEASLQLIQQLLTHYKFAYKENPVGSENSEITEQLLGKNPKRIVFIDTNISNLKENELVDQWDTPYFFHALSGQKMEIRSAGPDQQLWNSDDIITRESL